MGWSFRKKVLMIRNQWYVVLESKEILPGRLMGTTRMGTDRGKSVANAEGQSHDHPNLWFAGSSLFPTSGTVNPTLTIAALALRTAEAIRSAMRQ